MFQYQPSACFSRRAAFAALALAMASTLAACGQRALPAAGIAAGADPKAASRRIARVAVGSPGQSCAIYRSGAVYCWGQLGLLGGGGTAGKTLVPTRVALPGPARDVALSGEHSCALLESGQIACWGYNHVGQVGDLAKIREKLSTPRLLSLQGARAIAVGWHWSCAARTAGHVSCWGAYDQTKGFDNHASFGPALKTVPDLSDVVSVVASPFGGICALNRFGRVACAEKGKTAVVGGLAQVVQLSRSTTTTCAVRTDGRALCWGSNSVGALGLGFVSRHVPTPTQVVDLTDIVQIAAAGPRTCALRRGGAVSCWGVRLDAVPPSMPKQPRPRSLAGLPPMASISGSGHFCGVSRDDDVYCWGSVNRGGELGSGDTNATEGAAGRPVRVVGLP